MSAHPRSRAVLVCRCGCWQNEQNGVSAITSSDKVQTTSAAGPPPPPPPPAKQRTDKDASQKSTQQSSKDSSRKSTQLSSTSRDRTLSDLLSSVYLLIIVINSMPLLEHSCPN